MIKASIPKTGCCPKMFWTKMSKMLNDEGPSIKNSKAWKAVSVNFIINN